MKHGLDAVATAMSKIALYSQKVYCLVAYTLSTVKDDSFFGLNSPIFDHKHNYILFIKMHFYLTRFHLIKLHI